MSSDYLLEEQTPYVHSRTITDPPDIDGTVYEYHHYFYACKHGNRYKLKYRAITTLNKPLTDPLTTLHQDTKEFIKKGRYKNYIYVRKPSYV